MVVPTKWIQTAQQTGLRLHDAGKVIAAGAAGAALVAGNVAQGFLGKASKTAANLSHKKPKITLAGRSAIPETADCKPSIVPLSSFGAISATNARSTPVIIAV